jgi:hypothetical protein
MSEAERVRRMERFAAAAESIFQTVEHLPIAEQMAVLASALAHLLALAAVDGTTPRNQAEARLEAVTETVRSSYGRHLQKILEERGEDATPYPGRDDDAGGIASSPEGRA